jgi:NAD(P)H-dependent FMN reductase
VVRDYSYDFNAAIKNAVDYLNREWQYKPFGFVSYGGLLGRSTATIGPLRG